MESDSDMFKLTTDDQMEVLALLMQMEKLPEFTAGSPHESAELFSLSPEAAGISLDLSWNSPLPPPHTSHSSTSSVGNSVPASQPDRAPPRHLTAPSHNVPASGRRGGGGGGGGGASSIAEMREVIFRIAMMQPIHIDPEAVKQPKRRNVRISKDPQSVAARHRRERISERIRILQRLVPGGTKMDTASMLDEAIHYVKFLKGQVQSLEQASAHNKQTIFSSGGPVAHANNHAPSNNLL
ncbi:hypothetical protein SAY86_026194 [Trapa natans]|uniref:BHLH domain-containing protein n=1 Tax=Trapa natans TaxID=22666 RepID=A0AAN7KHI3_TRANT|nr:hypothetical protein SAY86_026194 [Trapa natans]